MAVTLFPDGVPCALQEAFDLSFLRQWGKVFRVFDQQDSGNLCFGLEDGTHRYFVKFAGARPVRYKGEPERAVELLKQSVRARLPGPGPPGFAAPAVGGPCGGRLRAAVPLDGGHLHGEAVP